jgi:hypothetical protein
MEISNTKKRDSMEISPKVDLYLIQTTKTRIIFTIIMISFTSIGIMSINEASAFSQYVTLHIDKTNYFLGDYGVILKNLNTGEYTRHYYKDTTSSPFVVVYGNTNSNTLDGDKIQACVAQMSTSKIACDYRYADSSKYSLDFFIDMNDAIVP